jgi:HEAT repeat protein
MGYQAWRTLTTNDSSTVRALAAARLGKNPDAKDLQALRTACGDKKWQVRAAAICALGQSGIRSQEDFVAFFLYDENDTVRYNAAVAFIKLKARRQL